ncbi:MAG: glycolate oxidase subunit GlcF [Gammaproteobacteria bacterium]
MQTHLAEFVKQRPEHQELQQILRACVHCGFCTATCPTYQLLGDERDGPRGRIYLLKQALEGEPVSRTTQLHLDRCLTCRACETTCPAGVRYGRLLDLGRVMVAERVPRGVIAAALRRGMLAIFPYRKRFNAVLAAAETFKPLLPKALRRKLPQRRGFSAWPPVRHKRKLLILPGCVQSGLAPSIDHAAAQVLDTLGISLIPVAGGGCCGALHHHLDAGAAAMQAARRNIDACRPYLQQGAEAVVSTASGCGVMLKEYGELLQYEAAYAEKAAAFSASVKDLGEILSHEDLTAFKRPRPLRVAFQSPCTLQHGQKLPGVVEGLLRRLGFELTPVADAHLCCGSAGVYSLLQAQLSGRLLRDKLHSLQQPKPDVIATANIGCLTHLQSAADVPVLHWIELLADRENKYTALKNP